MADGGRSTGDRLARFEPPTLTTALAPHDTPPTPQEIATRSLGLGAVLAGAGVVIAVVVLLISEMASLLLPGVAVGALFGAAFGGLFALIGGVVRNLRPNLDHGREATPAFLGAMVGAGAVVRMAFGGTALAVTLMVFWGALGLAMIAALLHHEFATTPHD